MNPWLVLALWFAFIIIGTVIVPALVEPRGE